MVSCSLPAPNLVCLLEIPTSTVRFQPSCPLAPNYVVSTRVQSWCCLAPNYCVHGLPTMGVNVLTDVVSACCQLLYLLLNHEVCCRPARPPSCTFIRSIRSLYRDPSSLLATPENKINSFEAVIHLQESPPHKAVRSRMQLTLHCDSPNTSRRFALGVTNALPSR